MSPPPGVQEVHAVIGGFHLGKANDEDIAKTIAAIQALTPTLISPTHCTGFKAMSEFARAMPEQFTACVVGTTYLF